MSSPLGTSLSPPGGGGGGYSRGLEEEDAPVGRLQSEDVGALGVFAGALGQGVVDPQGLFGLGSFLLLGGWEGSRLGGTVGDPRSPPRFEEVEDCPL